MLRKHRSGPAAVLVLALAACAPVAEARPPKATAGALGPLPDALAADPVLQAMDLELGRTMARLALPGHERPYYVAYVVKERVERRLGGKLGALYDVVREHERRARVDVRVGSWEFDSSEDEEAEWPYSDGYEPGVSAPLGDDRDGLRHTLWLLTDLRYKQALSSYLKLKGKRVFEADRKRERPSHSPAAPVVRADPPEEISFDEARWQEVVRAAGEVLGADPAVFDSEVWVAGGVETRWAVTSEGTRIRTVQPLYEVHLTAWSRAPDGMLLDQSLDLYGRTQDELPALEGLLERTRGLLRNLAALRAAPQLDPITGPAILEPAATGVFFHEVLGHRLEGHRQDDEEEGQTFTDHLGRPILPPFLSVHDDPTLGWAGGTPLNGAYAIDDEGVPAERVVLVDHGVLRGFLMGRRPVSGFRRSNGHGRSEGVNDPVPRMGNLEVVAHEPVSRERLKEMLLEEVRRQGKPYGLVVRDITGGSTNTSSYGYQAFKGEARMVYKVDATTGEETLVRGVEIVGTPLTTLSKILAASDEKAVFNGYCGAESGMVPVSTIAPATLFQEIELQRSARGRSKAPILPPPEISPRSSTPTLPKRPAAGSGPGAKGATPPAMARPR